MYEVMHHAEGRWVVRDEHGGTVSAHGEHDEAEDERRALLRERNRRVRAAPEGGERG